MKVITVDSKAFKELSDKLDNIDRYVKEHTETQSGKLNGWVDNLEVCTFLQISNRTLQRLRSKKLVNYAIIGGKSYFKLSEIERMLDEHLIKANPQGFQSLVEHFHKRINKNNNL